MRSLAALAQGGGAQQGRVLAAEEAEALPQPSEGPCPCGEPLCALARSILLIALAFGTGQSLVQQARHLTWNKLLCNPPVLHFFLSGLPSDHNCSSPH